MKQVLLAALLITGCGSDVSDWIHEKVDKRFEDRVPDRNIDPVFLPSIQLFQQEAAARSIDLPYMNKLRVVQFGTIEKKDGRNIIGICKTWTNSRKQIVYTEIIIDNSMKDQTETCKFKALMFHELGHCVLRKHHEDDHPKVIMSPTIVYEYLCERNWEQLVEQFFTGEEVEYH